MGSSGAAQAYDVGPVATELLASGEETIPRLMAVSASVSLAASGRVYLSYFTARKTEALTQVNIPSGGTAQTAATICRAGYYLVAANGDLTLDSSIVNDATLWLATFTQYTRAFSAPWNKVMGQRYAFAVICVTAGVLPALIGQVVQGGFVGEGSRAPRLFGQLSGQADLPATIATGAVTTNDARFVYASAVP